jgi:hypothetical protein
VFRSLRGGVGEGVEVAIGLEGAWRMRNDCVAMRMSVRVFWETEGGVRAVFWTVREGWRSV